MGINLSKSVFVIWVICCIAFSGQTYKLYAAEEEQNTTAADLLSRLQDEKITVYTRSGDKIKGKLREVTQDSLKLEKKKAEMECVALIDIVDIKKSGGAGSMIGGVFTGFLLGTGGVFAFSLIMALLTGFS